MIQQTKDILAMDSTTSEKISIFYLARMLLMLLVLLSTIFLKQEVLGDMAITQIFISLFASFVIATINTIHWRETLKIRKFIPSQLLYDLLLTSYLVYLTGVNDSIFLFLYLLNIVFAAVVFQLNGALIVASASGITFAFIYAANNDMDVVAAWYNLAWNELLFLLTALLCGQFMDELKRQKILLESQRQNIEVLEQLNEKLLNSVPMGIILADENDYVIKINSTALALLHLTHAPNFRVKFHELLPELKEVIPAWQNMKASLKHRFLFRGFEKSKPTLALQVVTIPGSGEGKKQNLIVFQDMAKILELEAKLEFETKLAATGQLAAGIAHEIRNPLASISGSIELLSNTIADTGSQEKKLITIALKEIYRLNALITDFLEFAKPKDSSGEIVNLSRIASEVREAVENQIKNKDVTITSDIPADLEIFANEERLKQVFFNLFLNSIEAKTNNPLHIHLEVREQQGEIVELLVKDDGPGIPREIRGKIFDPFFTTKESGTGLGLATVAQIMRAAKGDIVLLEPSQKGTSFVLKIPKINPNANPPIEQERGNS